MGIKFSPEMAILRDLADNSSFKVPCRFITVPDCIRQVRVFSKPRPAEAPDGYDKSAWPLYLVAHAFRFNRKFGLWFLAGLITDVILSRIFTA